MASCAPLQTWKVERCRLPKLAKFEHRQLLKKKTVHLHKLILRANEERTDEIHIDDIPGGPKTFELCAKFCYGMTVTLNAYNVVAARCAAEYLEMAEDAEKGNLIYKIEVFLNSSVFRSWKDSIIVLQTVKPFMPLADELKIVSRCVDSIASKVSVDPSDVHWSYTYNKKQQREERSQLKSQLVVPRDWWIDDLCELEIDLYKRAVVAIKSKAAMPKEVIWDALCAYAMKWLPNSVDVLVSDCNTHKNRSLVEIIVKLLPSEKGPGCACGFLLKLLKVVTLIGIDGPSKEELINRISAQLDEASLKDLLIPARPPATTVYDVGLVQSIVSRFLSQDQKDCHGYDARCGNELVLGSASMLVLGKLIDGYLAQIAHDVNLELSVFIRLFRSLPDAARPVHDRLYAAIDIYIQIYSEKSRGGGLESYLLFTFSTMTSLAHAALLPSCLNNKNGLSLQCYPSPFILRSQRWRKRFPSKVVSAVSVTAPRSPSTTGSVKHDLTMTEKILSKASERTDISPGENIWINIDVLMTHDVCGPGTIGIFKKEFGENAKVWDREKIVIIPDHYIFTADERANRNVDILRDFAMEQNIKYFYDIKDLGNFQANPDYKGVCHVALAQEGHCRPGEVLLGTDSHTCNAGAFGQFATGIGNTDAGFVMGTGKLLIKVPPTMRFVLDGEMPSYLLAKDLILQIIGEISVSGATYRSMEFVGSAVESLSMEERMTLCNMVVEAGGKNGVVPVDQITLEYLEGKTSKSFEPVYSDGKSRFFSEHRFDVSNLEPVVAKPHSPDNRALARECKDVKIDRVYIGSCTGGKTEDFMAAAKVFLASGGKVKVPTFLVPATQKVWMDLYTLPVPGSDGKTCSEIFMEAGCDTPASPNCGACLGGPRDTYARLNEPQVCVSTTNRNFPGRMGHKEGQIYLASPYTAAASALTGFVTDPRDFLQ